MVSRPSRLLSKSIPDLGNDRDASVGSINAALRTMGLPYQLEDVSVQFMTEKPGPIYNVLNITVGGFVVRLRMQVDGKSPQFHTVCWGATQQKLIDNGGQEPLAIDSGDKAGPKPAKRAFRKLLDAHKQLKKEYKYDFDITNVYELRSLA